MIFASKGVLKNYFQPSLARQVSFPMECHKYAIFTLLHQTEDKITYDHNPIMLLL